MRQRLLYLTLFLVQTISYGQKQGNIWIFGQGGALDFNSGTPTAFSGSQVFGNPTQDGDYLYSEGCTSISDSSGSLLFYSNGEKVWNKLNQIMPNGDSLMGFYSSTSAAFTIPDPLSDSLYYLFTTDGMERNLQNGLRYSLINMCLDNGRGDVMDSQKNIFLLDTVSEKLCAIAHPNGTDIWLIAHKHFTNSFYAYLITATGINSPIITSIGTINTGNFSFHNGCGTAIGQMKASSNGSKIGLVFSNVVPSVAEIFDFNSTTGIVSNVISLQTNASEYGIEFSPDNSKVYIRNNQGLFQFDISSENQATINSTKTQITSFICLPAGLQLGPDGKIYVPRCSNLLGVINNPNNAGTTCNYIDNAVNISPAVNNTSLPSFIAGYNYKNNKLPDCLSSGIENIFLSNKIKIYPNPFYSQTTLQTDFFLDNATLIVVNVFGYTVKQMKNISGTTVTLKRDNLPSGLYFIQLVEDNKIITTKKLIITD